VEVGDEESDNQEGLADTASQKGGRWEVKNILHCEKKGKGGGLRPGKDRGNKEENAFSLEGGSRTETRVFT